ncbi:MerR family transcriptional regulator [Nocardioides sp.]|uniref:MerR family transcriptional regulator n=1 Tax=Nocardioides sp. TaxID=35761 RepID=UPI002B27881C|nr:MerR family transcriptional regulator [Nocardioides sp.]
MSNVTAHLSIGDFARATGLSAKALRLYDEMGLLVPAEVDAFTGYRRYAPAQLDRARLVARLRLAGMPLARIRLVADLPPDSAAAELTSYWRQVEADTGSAGRLVAELVRELRRQERDMTVNNEFTTHPEAAVRLGIGGRDTQEDAVRVGAGLYAVADGVGAVRGVASVALEALTEPVPGDDALAVLDAGVSRAARAIADHFPDQAEAATTLTVVVLDGERLVSAHVGDSRLYLVRGGSLTRLTRDHTLVQTLVEEGRLTAEEARNDERRVVLNRAVAATAGYAPDLAVHATEPGDRLVLTTDGVHGRVDPAALAGLLLTEASADDVAGAVVDVVEAAGADDNYAVLVVDLP